MSDSGEELLEYEVEDPTPDPPPYRRPDPVLVCVDGPVVSVPAVPHHNVYRTVVLTSDNPAKQLLSIDPLRVRAYVISLDTDVVITSNQGQAESATNLLAGLTNPDGAVLTSASLFPLQVDAVGEVWATAPAGTYPARVVVVSSRRSP